MTRRSLNPVSPRSSVRTFRWALAGCIVGVFIGLSIAAPAHWLTNFLQKVSANHLQFSHIRGTFWQGSAQLTLTGGNASRDAVTLPERIDWALAPAWEGLRVKLRADCCMQQPMRIKVAPHWGGFSLQLANHQSRWPAALLSGLGTPWNTIQPQGSLALSTQAFSATVTAGRVSLNGQLELDANALSSQLSTIKPMGSYKIQLTGGSPTKLALETREGSLQISGSGEWIGARLRFSGEAYAAPGREAALANLLNIIGRRNGARSIITIG